MRFSTIETIYKAALEDETLYFISGDLGHAKRDEFENNIAERYFNAGMSEQNIIGVASGLALRGMKVVVYSIVPFITLRCLEQIKVDICYHDVDVTIIGVGGGFAYGVSGVTHYSIEEVSALRAIPNIRIICPAGPTEAKQLTEQALKLGGPNYIRIGRGKEEDIAISEQASIGKGHVAKPGSDITIIGSGTILSEALVAAELLDNIGINTEVINHHTVKPLDTETVLHRARNRRAIFTVEEHNIIGGLGSAVAELISETNDCNPLFFRFGVRDTWPNVVGTQSYLRELSGISGKKIATTIQEILSNSC